jgi:starch phosphorylase
VVWERARHLHQETGCSFWEALSATAAGNVFTTHTPVPAGFDTFSPDLAVRYFASYATELGVNPFDLIGLGRVEPLDGTEPLNMAVLALRHANSCNGVSKLHGVVSRSVFSPEFPRFPLEEIPIRAVTNGIHTDSWISEGMERLLKHHLGPTVDEHPDAAEWDGVRKIPDVDLWKVLREDRARLVNFAQRRLRRQLGARGVSPEEASARAARTLDPDILTIGFARRFATYKRATLFLRDQERFRRMLLDPVRPIQIVIAGKAHPADDGGKNLIRELFAFGQREDVRHRIVFLEDYDMRVTGHMVQGVDVWLNTPRRPMEASGTSGMKVLPNGGLNLSIRDGWWAEAYAPGVGWAIGDEVEHPDPETQDARDAESLYALLEQEVIPLFYDRDKNGVPRGWMARVKESMRCLCPEFSTNRMVRQYVDEHYLPAAIRYRQMTANNMADARSLADWKAQVRWHWEEVKVEEATASKRSGAVTFRAKVRLGPLRPDMVAVQAYAEPNHAHGNGNGSGNGKGSHPEVVTLQAKDAEGSVFRFEGKVASERSAEDFTLRVIPQHPKAHQPMDVPLVRWEE